MTKSMALCGRAPGFLAGQALSLTRLSSRQARICALRLCVAGAQAATTIKFSSETDDAGTRICFSGPHKPFLLRDVVKALQEAGLVAKHVYLRRAEENDDTKCTFLVTEQPSEGAMDALRNTVGSIWDNALGLPPREENGKEGQEFGHYLALPLPPEAYEDGIYFFLDSGSHSKWSTLTVASPGKLQTYRKVLDQLAANNVNMVFCHLQSTDPSIFYASDVYHLTDLEGGLLDEADRTKLHNDLVGVFY